MQNWRSRHIQCKCQRPITWRLRPRGSTHRAPRRRLSDSERGSDTRKEAQGRRAGKRRGVWGGTRSRSRPRVTSAGAGGVNSPHAGFLVMLATALLHQDLSFYPSMVCRAPRPSHTHYMVPFAPLWRCPCSAKSRPCVIPDVTCIILVHTTNTADKITTHQTDQRRTQPPTGGGLSWWLWPLRGGHGRGLRRFAAVMAEVVAPSWYGALPTGFMGK